MESENFKEQVSAVFKALFAANSISFDEEECQFVGFIDHQFIYGVYGPKSINLRIPDHNVDKLEKNIKQRLDSITLEPMPDIRPVYSAFWDRGVQITFGKLPWGWQPSD
jgi:hypothetical protein